MHRSDALRARVSAGLILASRVWRRQVDEAVATLGLTEATAFPLIHLLRAGDGARQGAVAEALGIEGPSLVRLLDQLCAAGLMERREDATDRRAKTLHLTLAGHEIASRVEDVLHTVRKDVLGGLAEADLQACLRVFAAIQA